MAHGCTPSTQEAEAVRASQVQRQSRLQSEFQPNLKYGVRLSQKNNKIACQFSSADLFSTIHSFKALLLWCDRCLGSFPPRAVPHELKNCIYAGLRCSSGGRASTWHKRPWVQSPVVPKEERKRKTKQFGGYKHENPSSHAKGQARRCAPAIPALRGREPRMPG